MTGHQPRARGPQAPWTAPPLLALVACRIAGHALPEDARRRYAQEWQADLAEDPAGATRYAISVLLHVLALRAAVTAGAPRLPRLCRVRLHHYVVVHDNPENHRLATRVCARCGRIDDDAGGPSSVDDSMAWGASMGMH